MFLRSAFQASRVYMCVFGHMALITEHTAVYPHENHSSALLHRDPEAQDRLGS